MFTQSLEILLIVNGKVIDITLIPVGHKRHMQLLY